MDAKHKPATAPTAYWLDIDDHPPPAGRKMLLLSNMGIAMIGVYSEPDPGECVRMIAWSPLPKIPAALVAKKGFRK